MNDRGSGALWLLLWTAIKAAPNPSPFGNVFGVSPKKTNKRDK